MANGPNPYPVRYMNLNWANYADGELIRDEDVVRALNGRWYTDDEIRRFRLKSQDRCPTYGNCRGCLASGPVGATCPECGISSCRFVIYFVDIPVHPRRILDAQALAVFMGEGHTAAVGNRTYQWGRTPMEQMHIVDLHSRIVPQFRHFRNDNERERRVRTRAIAMEQTFFGGE